MRKIAVAIVFLFLCGDAHSEGISLKECTKTLDDFRIRPYLVVANKLQQLGQKKALTQLRKWAQAPRNNVPVIILARMLLENKDGGEIRRPMLGGPGFLGDTSFEDWPIEPITLYKGVPILITFGYTLAGLAESGRDYLDICIKEGSWRPVKYDTADHAGLEKIIDEFLRTTDWKKPLAPEEIAFLKKQAGNDIPMPRIIGKWESGSE